MKAFNLICANLILIIISFGICNTSIPQSIDPETESAQTIPFNNKFDPLTKLIPPTFGDYPFNSYSYVVFGNNSTSNNGRAPQGSRKYIRTVYLVPESDMYASGFGVSKIKSIGWTWNNPFGAGAPSAQNIQTTGNIKVYLQCTDDVTYTKGTNFTTALTGMTMVANTTITIPAGADAFATDVLLNGAGASCFSSCLNKGLYIAFDYETTSTIATPLGSPTVHCDAAFAGSIATYQSNTIQGTGMTMSSFRPETRFGGGETLFAEDVNSDYIVDLDDMSICDNEAEEFCSGCFCLADVNNDGAVDITDLALISNKLCSYVQ